MNRAAHMTKESDAFEQQIHRLHELIEGDGADVTWNDHIPDPDNPIQPRQIDITIRRGDVLTLVECRLHKDRQDVTWIEELIGRRLSLQASSVIAVSSSGFTQGAIKKAQSHGVFLRDFKQLTRSEVETWGCLTAMTIYYYQYENLELSLFLHPSSIHKLKYDRLTEELRNYPGRQSLFNASAEQLDSLRLLEAEPNQRKDASFRIRLRMEEFRLCDEAVVEVEFAGRARLMERQLEVPAVLAYQSSSVEPTDDSVVLQKTSLGPTGAIVHNSHRMATVLDLSRLDMAQNCQFRYFRTTANKEMDMDSFELIGGEHLYATGGPMVVQIMECEAPHR
jgi:hypothetical protein